MDYNSLKEMQDRPGFSFINFNESFWLTIVSILAVVVGICFATYAAYDETKKQTEILQKDGKFRLKKELQKSYFKDFRLNLIYLLVILSIPSILFFFGGGATVKYKAIVDQAFENIGQKYGEDKIGNMKINDYGDVIKAEGVYYSFEDNTSIELNFAFDAKGEPHIMIDETVDKELIKKIENEVKQ